MSPTMSPRDERRVLLWTVVITAAITLFGWLAGGDLVGALVLMPIVATVTFWSMRISTRMARRRRGVDDRPGGAPADEPPPTPPSSERPEHARRRRSRRQSRGRRR